ncbi:outer spore wall protein RRT8-like, partial [Teratosphaeria destructans]
MSSSEKIKETAKGEVERVRKVAEEGARSGAYLYPLKGIYYFATHKDLYKPLLSRLAPTMTLGLGVTTAMFLFTYVPQVAILVFTSGPLAALTTILLVLSESSTLTMVLSRALLIQDSLIDTFDGTLVARGETALVQQDRQVKSGGAGGAAIARLGKLVRRPFAKYTPAALGTKNGPAAHTRYFQLKGMNAAQRERFVEARKGAYTGFGVAATLLEMIPLAGILFAYTNTCGAALWAADLEQASGTSPQLREQAARAERE